MIPTALPWYMFISFYIILGIVYLVFGVSSRHKLLKLILKCTPIIALFCHVLSALLVLSWSKSEDEGQSDLQDKVTTNGAEIVKIQTFLWGLAFSCIGDACLVIPKIGVFGVVSFAIAVSTYIKLFGLSIATIISLDIGGVLFGVPILLVLIGLITFLFKQDLPRMSKHFKLLLLLLVSVYFCLISLMVWSSLLNFKKHRDISSIFGAVGAFLFFISDLSIAANAVLGAQFVLFQGRVLIMTTYYGAQLFIALSV